MKKKTKKQIYESEYNTWISMIHRCTNPTHPKYPWYGARGITVCARWRKSFDNFLQDMGKRPENLSLDRIDNDKGYSPDNCRWATIVEQNNNRREFSRLNSRKDFALRDLDDIRSKIEEEYREGTLPSWEIIRKEYPLTHKEFTRLLQEIRSSLPG